LGYKTLIESGEALLIVKRSRFIARSMNATDELRALSKIAEIKKKHYDASHNVYAYVIREGNIVRSSDDGEPSGTSGASVLSVITGEGLVDTLVVVTRYFGGTLLGAGGLSRAYGQAAKMSIENAKTALFTLCSVYTATVSYHDWGNLQKVTQKFGGNVTAEFTDNITCRISLPRDVEPAFLNEFYELFNRRIEINKIGEEFVG